MPTCCGAERSSRFCPDCGKEIGHHGGLASLFAHCRITEKKLGTDAARWQADADDSRKSADQRQWSMERAEATRKAAAKWKAWGDALAELLATARG